MHTMLDAADREALLRRVDAVTSASMPRWGGLTADRMLCHLHESARLALGEVSVKPKGPGIFRVFPLKHLLLYVVPFPKSAPTAPELLQGSPAGTIEAEKARLKDALTRLALGPKSGPGPAHPLFGPLSREEWGVASFKHTDHHLRQFGV